MKTTLILEKENFKFSVSHFTIFDAQRAERLHGHNYALRVECEVTSLDPKTSMAIDFNQLKPVIRKVCDTLDEHVLIPENSPYLKISKIKDGVIVQFHTKTYQFPLEDVRLLPLTNITSEALSHYVTQKLVTETAQLPLVSIAVTVTETSGQSAKAEWRKP